MADPEIEVHNGHRVLGMVEYDEGGGAVLDERWSEVFRRLGVLETQGARNGAMLESLKETSEGKVARHEAALFGTEDSVGVLTRVHALEQTAATRGRIGMAIATAGLGVVVSMAVWRMEGCERVLHEPRRPAPASALENMVQP